MAWTDKTIGDLGLVVTGKTPSTKNRDFYNGGYPFVTPTDLDWDSYYVRKTHTTVSEEAKSILGNKFLPKNSVFFTCIASVGKMGIASEECLTNQQINSVIPNEGFDFKFVYYLLRGYVQKIRSIGLSGGSAVPIINKSGFCKIKVRVPDNKKSQIKIGAILSGYDDLIENNQRRIALLEKFARFLYREWFIKPIDLDLMSKHKISDVWNIRYGKNLPTSKISETGKYPVHGAGGVIGHYNEKNVEQSLCLVSCRGHVGNVRRTFGPAFVTSNSFIFFPTKEFKNIPFFFTMFALEQVNLAQARTGAAQPQLTLSNIKHFEVAIPSDERLRQFSDICTPIYQQIDCLFFQNEKLAKARDLLLPRLIDGRIKP